MTQISIYHKDTESAVVVTEDDNCFAIEYYNEIGSQIYKEKFEGKSLRYVEDAAENWALGIKILP